MQITQINPIAFIYDTSTVNPSKEVNNTGLQEAKKVDQKDNGLTLQTEKDLKTQIEDIKLQQIIQQLKRIEQKVKAHEMAHKSAGGDLAGSVHYKYTTGPDGKRYIVGGEVPIKFKQGKTPEETIEIAQRIKAAALAPADPSPQDLRVAARATAMEMQARAELYKKQMEESIKSEEDKNINSNINIQA